MATMTTGARVRALREGAALTVKQLAVAVEMTPQAIRDIEADKADPRLSNFSAILRATTGKDFAEIIDRAKLRPVRRGVAANA